MIGVLGVVVFGGNFMMVSLCVVWFVWLCVYVVYWLQRLWIDTIKRSRFWCGWDLVFSDFDGLLRI